MGDDATSVEPFPQEVLDGGAASISAEIDRRVDEWAASLDVRGMSVSELVETMDQISQGIAVRREGDDWWLYVRELGTRRGLLCTLLPADHRYRGGEYCE